MKIKVGQKFSWDTSELNDYIDENRSDLNLRLVEQSRSVRLMQTVQDIKGEQAIHLLDETIVWQNGNSCGFNPGGTDKLTDRTIKVVDIKVEKEYCNKDLVKLWTQTQLRRGASAELAELPYEAVIMENILAKNALLVDKAIWQSNTTSGNPNLNKFKGFIAQLDAVIADVVDMNPDGIATITDSNAFSVFRKAFKACPSELTQDVRFGMFAGYEVIQHLIQNMIDLNMFHYKAEMMIGNGSDADVQSLPYVVIPGTMCKVWYVPGLNGINNFYAGLIGMNGEYLVGTDTESDFTNIESGYDARLQSLWYRLQFRLGVSFPFVDQMCVFKPTAS